MDLLLCFGSPEKEPSYNCRSGCERLHHIHGKADRFGRPRGYVGDLKSNRKVEWKGKTIKVRELAASIAPGDRKEMRIGDKRQWYLTVSLRIPDVTHKVRIVILWRYRHDSEPIKVLVTNRITWEVSRIVRVYRHRWTGTETFHRDGKQQLGLGDCQLRDAQGQTRHMYLVMLAYSLLMGQLRQGCAQEWALPRLMTIGEACRAMAMETLRKTLAWAIEQVTRWGRPYEQVLAQLGLSWLCKTPVQSKKPNNSRRSVKKLAPPPTPVEHSAGGTFCYSSILLFLPQD